MGNYDVISQATGESEYDWYIVFISKKAKYSKNGNDSIPVSFYFYQSSILMLFFYEPKDSIGNQPIVGVADRVATSG